MSEGQQPPLDPLKLVGLLRKEIQFEHQLIANRLSALMVQPFLLAAFAVAAAGEAQHHQHFLSG